MPCQGCGSKIHEIMHTSVTNISLLLLVLLDALQLAAGATGLFSQGATAVVHGCSICALGPKGESLHCRRGVSWSPPVSVTQCSTLSTLGVLPQKDTNKQLFM